MALVTGGTITGLAVATMHYLGMAGVRLDGQLEYDTLTVALSVVIAVVAATSALWAAVSVHGFPASLGASLVMAVGLLAPVVLDGQAPILTSALCVGGTFMVITMAGMQEAPRLGEGDAPS